MTNAPAHVDPAWLALRGPVDFQARTDFTAALVARLAQHLDDVTASERAARLVDIGAGSGAGALWLQPRLPTPQQWRLIDPDKALVRSAGPVTQGWARAIVAGVRDLPRILADEPADAVTCQALLDVLTADELHPLVMAATSCRAAVLTSMSVTGHVTLSPQHPVDQLVNNAFNAHQRRHGRLGPTAGPRVADALRAAGYSVISVESPWRLGTDDAGLTVTWLRGRARAACEQSPGDTQRIEEWLQRRLALTHSGQLTATVGHVDVLGLPERS